MSAGSERTAGSIDFEESNPDVAPSGVTRLARKAGQLVVSTDGVAFVAVGGACASDPWGDMVAEFVAGKVATLTKTVFRSTCLNGFSQEVELAAASGTGTVVQVAGVGFEWSSGATAGGNRIARNKDGEAAGGAAANFVANARTSPAAVIGRIRVIDVTADCILRILNLTAEGANEDSFFGVTGATSTVNWSIKVGAGAAVDTGVAFPTGGAAAAWTNVAFISDGTNWRAWNVDTGVQIGADYLSVGGVNGAAHVAALAFNGATNATAGFQASDWACIVVPAA